MTTEPHHDTAAIDEHADVSEAPVAGADEPVELDDASATSVDDANALVNSSSASADEPVELGESRAAKDDLDRFCLLQFAGRLWAIDGRFSKGIVNIDSIISIPGAPRYLVGVHYRRGRILPVLDLAFPFGLPATPITLPAVALETAAAGCEAAVICNAIVGFELADAARISSFDEDTGTGWLLGELDFRQGRAAVIDIASLIAMMKITTDTPAQNTSIQAPTDQHGAGDHQASQPLEE